MTDAAFAEAYLVLPVPPGGPHFRRFGVQLEDEDDMVQGFLLEVFQDEPLHVLKARVEARAAELYALYEAYKTRLAQIRAVLEIRPMTEAERRHVDYTAWMKSDVSKAD